MYFTDFPSIIQKKQLFFDEFNQNFYLLCMFYGNEFYIVILVFSAYWSTARCELNYF